jgi:hypothetical protein
MPSANDIRDRGLALISRVNRWLIVCAVAFSGLIALIAAHAFHGRALSASGSSAGASSPLQHSRSSAGNGSLQQPAQAPTPASPAASAPVVSGGS